MKRVPWAVAISRPLQYDGGTTWIVIVTVMKVMMMVMMVNVLGLVAFFHVDLK